MQSRQTHIDELRPSTFADQYVGGLDVTMHHITTTGMVQGISNLQSVIDGLFE